MLSKYNKFKKKTKCKKVFSQYLTIKKEFIFLYISILSLQRGFPIHFFVIYESEVFLITILALSEFSLDILPSPTFPVKLVLICGSMGAFQQLMNATVSLPGVWDADLCVSGPLNIPDSFYEVRLDESLQNLKLTAFAVHGQQIQFINSHAQK